GRPSKKDGRPAHPTITIKIVSYLIRDPKLDNMPRGTAVRDGYGRLWWKETIDKGNENLRPLGSRANTVWCR
ncbi:hypothetical protein QUB19_11075, partial [Microcoleus sp. B4-C5]|uniref:hypothetical protein n=1 Tax=Microcoleus sp. B4-C5 TaxID=2818664 RepID=UPI002FD5E2A1